MVKISNIIGLPIIYDSGKKSPGFLKDIIFNIGEKQIKGLVVEKTGFRKSSKIFRTDNIYDIGGGAVIIKEKPYVEYKCIKSDRKYTAIDKKKEEVKVYSKNGEDLGVVKDVYFNLLNGNIEAFELSDGVIQDIIDGRKIIPLIGKYEFGEDIILIGNDVVQEILNSGGGLRKKLFLRWREVLTRWKMDLQKAWL